MPLIIQRRWWLSIKNEAKTPSLPAPIKASSTGPMRKRCDFLFLTKRYKNKPGTYEQIFFHTQAAVRAHKSRTRRELLGDPGLGIIIYVGQIRILHPPAGKRRSEEHTSELQSLLII